MPQQKPTSNIDLQSVLKILNVPTPTNTGDAVNKTYTDAGDTSAKARANHTGTQVAATISDFDTQVRTNRLDQMAVPTAPVAFGSQRQTNLADPVNPQDSATKNYVDVQLAALVSGYTPKGTVRAYHSTGNINIAAPGTTLDGLTAATSDVFILGAQTDGTQNGPWVWNGAAAAMTRPTNWDTSAEAVLGSTWVVREGTSADGFAVLANDSTVTLGTTALSFVIRGLGANGFSGMSQVLGAITAGGSATITHNYGTRGVGVLVVRNGSPWDDVDVYVDRPTTNTVTVGPDIPYAANEYIAYVWKIA